MTSNNLPATFKGVVQSIEAKAITVRIQGEVIIFPKSMFPATIKAGDDVYISVMATEHYEKHHSSLAKTIVNTILGKKA